MPKMLVNRGSDAAGKQVLVHVRCNATGKNRREKRNGRDVVIVPSATLPDDVVMNGILYPADEIEKGFATLNDTPAPLGHPLVNGKFVSARHPEGINRGWIGAWNENVRRENGRVFLDKIIDVEVANRTEGGKAVLSAIDKGEAVHTSTGLLCELEDANGDVEYKHIARNLLFDHDAILIGEDGAATPADGVGMMVNAAGKAEEIEVINSVVEDAERELDWAADMAARAVERMERAPLLERIKSAIMEAITGSERETSANAKEPEMADDKQLEALSAKVNTLSESMGKIGETIGKAVTEAVKPLKDHVDQIAANQKAKDEAEKADLVKTIVKANILDEDSAKELTLNAARKLAEKAKPGKAAGLNGAFGNGREDEFSGYNLNADIDGKQAAGKEAN